MMIDEDWFVRGGCVEVAVDSYRRLDVLRMKLFEDGGDEAI